MRLHTVDFTDSADEETFKGFITNLDLKPPVLIKPNWGCSAFYTEAEILDWTLSAIDGEKIVVESYGWARTKEFIETGKMGSKQRSDLRKSDKWFLQHSGIDKVLEKHNVEFLNITEEIWGKRIADPQEVKNLVEKDFETVQFEKMYSEVPQRLYELRGGTLLSLAKLRLGVPPYTVSLSVKNLFGMIPGPGRYAPYHGKKDCNLAQSVLDINKIYRSLFDVKGVIEGVFTADVVNELPRTAKLYSNLGVLWACKDTIALDAIVAMQFGRNPSDIDYLRHPAETIGKWSDKVIKLGQEHSLVHLIGM
ncbi:MAG: DUF362 domain-containing protein [Candidatus Thorarchaeota archaeon]